MTAPAAASPSSTSAGPRCDAPRCDGYLLPDARVDDGVAVQSRAAERLPKSMTGRARGGSNDSIVQPALVPDQPDSQLE